MTRDEARAILEAHNKWRRGGDAATESPWALGRAIDIAVEVLARPDGQESAATEQHRGAAGARST